MPHGCAGVSPDPWCDGQVTHVRACVASTLRVPLSLATHDKFGSVTVTVRGKSHKYKAHGRNTRVKVSLGKRGRVSVRFLERLKVGGHLERVTFTRVYHQC